MGRLADPAVRLRWEERMGAFERSGLTVAQFCEQIGISTASFRASWTWMKRYAARRAIHTRVASRRLFRTGTS